MQLFTLCAKIRGRVQRKGEPHVRKIYTIETSNFEQDQLHFSLNDNEVNLQLKPAGQLIADSDDFAFIYLLDAGEDYHYLRFPPSSWENLVHILQKKKDPILRISEEAIELTNFYDELEMLVYNIEGNYNYGAEFVQTVEQHFKAILAE
nr:hypothetical protein [Lysinibacillus fusiformis]